MLTLKIRNIRLFAFAICFSVAAPLMAQEPRKSAPASAQPSGTKPADNTKPATNAKSDAAKTDAAKRAKTKKDDARPVDAKTEEAKPAAPKKPDYVKLIHDLNSAEFSVRDHATRELWRGGVAAEPWLIQAAKDANLESRSRINAILERFRYGIFPDTPAETVKLIHQFRRGDRSSKHRALTAMSKQKAFATVARLISRETDPVIQTELAARFTTDTESAIAQMIAEAKFTEADALLRVLTTFDTDGTQLRSYTAYLDLSKKLSGTLDQLAAEKPDKLDAPQRRLLAHLLKCRGDLDAALKIAREVNDSHLQADIHFRRSDWKQLAKNTLIPGDEGVEKLGFTAAFHQLAGHAQELQKSVAALKQFATDTPARAHHCGEALMITGHWQQADEVFAAAETTRRQRFELLTYQQNYAAAFKQLGIEKPGMETVNWFKQQLAAKEGETDTPKSKVNRIRKVFHEAILAAKTLQQLGEHEEAGRMFDELATAATAAGSTYFRTLFETIYQLDLEERTIQMAIVALQSSSNESNVFYVLFGTRSASARVIWKYLLEGNPNAADRPQQLFDLFSLMKHELAKSPLAKDLLAKNPPATKDLPSSNDFAETIDAFAATLKKAPRTTAISGYRIVAELCELHGLEAKAQEYCTAWAAISPIAEPRLKLGQSYSRTKMWDKASQSFREAWQSDSSKPLALFLSGHALTQLTEKAAEGQELMQRARMMPLGNSATRRTLAEGLEEYGLDDEALEEWRLILRYGAFDDWEGTKAWAVSRASRNVANAIRDSNEIEAADRWQHWMMFLLKTNMGFSSIRYYPAISAQIHRTRAKGLFKAQQIDRAIDEVWQAHRAAPGDIRLVLELWESMQKLEKHDVADKLFKSVEQSNRQVIEAFPNSPLQFNNLAWMMARTDRNVAAALPLAQRAVELRPNSAAYLDTLAEVHFRLGHRDEAIRFCKQAIELEPESDHHPEQLKRFSK